MTAAQFAGFLHYTDGATMTETYEWAVEHYRNIYGHAPTMVYINPHQPIEDILTPETVVIKHSAYILPNYMLVTEPRDGNMSEL